MSLRNEHATPAAILATVATLGLRDGLNEFCVELLVYILSFLDAKDVARCQRVSRAFCSVVKTSAQLQWKIECYISGVEDCSTTTLGLRQRVAYLRRWRDACKGLQVQWIGNTQEKLSLGTEFEVKTFGTTYALLHGSKITVCQPASQLKALPDREWAVKLGFSSVVVQAFAYDDKNQLLVVVECDVLRFVYNLHLYSTVTGGKHPAAHRSLISIPFPQYPPFDIFDHERRVSVSVCDSVLAFQAEALAFFSFAEIWVWDWKTGDVLLNLHGDAEVVEPHVIQLMDPSHCIVSFERGQEAEFFTDGVAVFSLSPGNPSRQQYSVALKETALLTLQLPEIDDEEIEFVIVTPRLDPCPSCTQSREGAFRRKDDSRLLRIDYKMEMSPEGELQAYDFVTPIKTVYSLLSTCVPSAPPRAVPWTEWAPDTRAFNYSPTETRFVSGTRYVIKRHPTTRTPKWTFKMYDFGPAATGAVDGAEQDPYLVKVPSTIHNTRLWVEPVESGSRLPYRLVGRRADGCREESAYLGEDYLVIFGNNKKRVYSV